MSDIGVEALPLSRKNIRDFADYVRRGLGLGDTPYIDIEKLLDLILPKAMPDFCYEVCPAQDMGQNHGLANPEERWMSLREDVYNRACRGHGRDRLTVIHELGHLLLHTGGRVMLRRGDSPPKAFRDPEWQANCFAGEFLVYYRLVDGCACPADLAERFGVTPSAAEVQWDKLTKARIL